MQMKNHQKIGLQQTSKTSRAPFATIVMGKAMQTQFSLENLTLVSRYPPSQGHKIKLPPDDDGHDRRTTPLAIRLYHLIYTVLRTGTR